MVLSALRIKGDRWKNKVQKSIVRLKSGYIFARSKRLRLFGESSKKGIEKESKKIKLKIILILFWCNKKGFYICTRLRDKRLKSI